MRRNRKAIQLADDESALLQHLYLAAGIPTDQYARRPVDLANLVQTFNDLTGRSFAPGDLRHYIVAKRKQSKWVRFEGTHKRLDSIPEALNPEQWISLGEVYQELLAAAGLGSDTLAFDDELAQELAQRFAERSGTSRIWPGQLLFAMIMAKRKRGEWIKVRTSPDGEPNIGFGDIGKVAIE
jgi:hypothetical protein